MFINFNNDNLLTASDFKIAINAASTATATVVEGDINFIITGGTAADTILAGGGADTINMGQGDSVNGGAGIDTFAFAAVTTASTITGGSGADIITLASGTNSGVSIGDTDGFTLSGGTTNTVAITTALASTTFSLAATTTNTITLASDVASTTITGGTGVDTITFTASKSNVATITGGTGIDVIDLGATHTGGVRVSIAGVIAVANRDTVTNFLTTIDKVGLGVDQTTAGTLTGVAAVVTTSTTIADIGNAAFALGVSSSTSDLIILTTNAAGANSGTLSATTDGTELLKALTTTAAVDTYTGITATANADKVYFATTQGGIVYIYYADAGAGNAVFANTEILLVGTFAGTIVAGDLIMV